MADEQTYGEKMVRLSFNPSSNELVDQLKRLTAQAIDLCHDNKGMEPRLAGIAISSYESAAMWAVKLATADQTK